MSAFNFLSQGALDGAKCAAGLVFSPNKIKGETGNDKFQDLDHSKSVKAPSRQSRD